MDILIGIIIKIIDIIVAIVSIFEQETSKLLSKMFRRKDKKVDEKKE
ncbi:hypothetical protein NLV77_001856 [Staphylococcus ureilyticus]|nr:hypothetical protein [Staphylococcus ureilyticus]SCS83689.1 Uncharacterised protein [Staphylococcus cohnii subsp. cohnii]